ncbi:MAG: discoidin domain-containing protein, partial [Spirochaetes bacterium]|nr:discoidin domain-containing protein [Spirochaetota bacterium]
MHFINISHKKFYEGTISDFSNEIDSEYSINNILKANGYWSSKKSNSISIDHFIIDYKTEIPVNYIEIIPSQNDKSAFPSDFQIEFSMDGKSWKVIQIEKSFNLDNSDYYSLNIPLTIVRYIKMLITRPGKVGTKFYSEIERFTSGISGVKEISSSSSLSYKQDHSNLLDFNNDTYWESNISAKKGRELIKIDLGNNYVISRLSFSSANIQEHGFPENFAISVSKDNDIWSTLFDQRNFSAEASREYLWDFSPTSCRFINISMDTVKTNKEAFSARIGGIQIFSLISAFPREYEAENSIPNASVFQYGIVKLSKDGEDTEDTVVRSNDSRLKEATTISKGVVQLAEDGQDSPSFAVQASDSRLKKATELRYGIVRLGKDREESHDVVVRGDDSRLKKATENNYGIMKICRDGEYSEFGVVPGNDSRLQHASRNTFGIVRLANNGEASANCAVQGDDDRLRDATINNKGIVELADDGEDKDGVVVQGNDKRLKDASITSSGIVELAENGEDREGVVVQGNDKRLKDATTKSKGIVELAENGEDRDGVVVQGSDKRIKNATTSSKGIVELAENGEDKDGVAVQGSDKRLKDAT